VAAEQRAVIVTGAAGGLGGPTVRLLAGRGWHVFAADLDAAGLAPLGDVPRVTPVILDVTDNASVAAAVSTVAAATSGLNGIVNFAGILTVGSVLDITEEQLRRVLDVNVLGMYRVNRAFFGLLLQRRGRIVNMSSETGHLAAAPFNGPYAMSKHAVEAYSDALRREVALLGVKVVKIQPGPFDTGMLERLEDAFAQAAAASPYFGEVIDRVKGYVAGEQAKAGHPRVLAAVVHRALTARRPKAAYPVRQNRERAVLDRLPTPVADKILARVLHRGLRGPGR
jgi:NAD(P)-dependent dehydrogenase (short-subunit alcohol dehydrogenase family)